MIEVEIAKMPKVIQMLMWGQPTPAVQEPSEREAKG
jgi:hypothetical protein